MITTGEIATRCADDCLPLLTLSEFFDGNTDQESLAPNQWGYGRPTLVEIASRLAVLEGQDDVAWVRVELHYDTEFDEPDGAICAEAIAICTTASESDLEARLDTESLQSDGVTAKGKAVSDLAWLCGIPAVPDGYRVLFLVWD